MQSLTVQFSEPIRKGKEEKKPFPSWISTKSFILMKQKGKALRNNQSEDVQKLGKELQKTLRQDRAERVRKVSVEIEEKLEDMDIIGAFNILSNWYEKYTGSSIKPSEVELETTKQKYENLFAKEALTNELPFPIEYKGEEVDDSIPDEEEIRKALFRMRNKKAPGLMTITTEHMKLWYRLSHPKKGEKIDKRALDN